MLAPGLLLIAFLATGTPARADDNPPAGASPIAAIAEPTVIFEVWPTYPAGTADTPTPLPPALSPSPEAATATGTSLTSSDTATPQADSPTPDAAAQPDQGQAAPPLITAALSTDTPTDTPTTIPTATATSTGTSTPTATATPSWLPPGPECSVKPGKAVMKLAVPYMHQVNDVTGVDGNWACGPTSVLMVLDYYGKLQPWPDYVAQQGGTAGPVPTPKAGPTSSSRAAGAADDLMKLNYAPYLTNVYTDNGHTYSAKAPDPRGNMLAGLYGTIAPSGLADWGRMKQVFQWYGLSTAYVSPTFNGVVAALKRGHPVILGNDLTAAGHIMVAIGYTSNNQIIVNDPYGNRFVSGYGANDGDGVYYAWSCSRVRNAIEVIGTYPPPTATPTQTPTLMPTAVPQTLHADSLGPGAAAVIPTLPATRSAIASATVAMSIGASALPPDTRDRIAQAYITPDHQSADKQSAGRQVSNLPVLAAQQSAPKPAYWLLVGPTLLAFAALVVMFIDWRKRRRPTIG